MSEVNPPPAPEPEPPLRPEVYEFSLDIEELVVTVGELIRISDGD